MSPLPIFVITILYFIQEINCVYGPPYPFDRITFVNKTHPPNPSASFLYKYRPPTQDEKNYMLLRCKEYLKQNWGLNHYPDYCGEPKTVLVSSSKTAMTTSGTTEINPIPSVTPAGFTTSRTTEINPVPLGNLSSSFRNSSNSN